MITLLSLQPTFLRSAEPADAVTLPNGARLTSSLRLADGTLAPMTYETARTWAYWHACRLPTRAEALAMAPLPHIPVQSMAWDDPDFGTLEGAKRYTKRVDYQIRARHDSEEYVTVDNESKVWVRDAATPGGPSGLVGMPAPGWALLVGFFDETGKPANSGAGAPGKKGYGPRGEPHNSSHVDYSMAPRFVMVDHETKRLELAALALALAGPSGSRSPTGREVADYFRLGTRGGQRTGYTAGWDWCAAGACWLGAEVGLGLGVHEWRITVHELIADARASGRWRDVNDIAEHDAPLVGDLVCFKRGGTDPRTPGALGHVETYIGDGRTISANSPGWLIKSGRLTSPDYVGYIAR